MQRQVGVVALQEHVGQCVAQRTGTTDRSGNMWIMGKCGSRGGTGTWAKGWHGNVGQGVARERGSLQCTEPHGALHSMGSTWWGKSCSSTCCRETPGAIRHRSFPLGSLPLSCTPPHNTPKSHSPPCGFGGSSPIHGGPAVLYLGHLLPVGLGVEGCLGEQGRVLLGGHTQLVVEGVVPDLRQAKNGGLTPSRRQG